MSPLDFLLTLWPTRDQGFVFVAAKAGDSFMTTALPLRDIDRRLGDWLDDHLDDHDCYFSPHVYSERRRRKEFVLPSRWLHCDIDDGNVAALEPAPSIVWETSPGRTQALWRLDERLGVEELEAFNRGLADQCGGDACWDAPHVLRIPGSVNHKPAYDRPRVRLLRVDWTPITDRPRQVRGTHGRQAPVSFDLDKHDAHELYRRYRVPMRYRVAAGDRSKALWGLGAHLKRNGATADEIACALWHSPAASRLRERARPLDELAAEVQRIMGKAR